jgi:hypothetical protein
MAGICSCGSITQGIKWKQAGDIVSFTPQSVYLHGNNPEYVLDKRPKSVSKFWDKETTFSARNQTPIPVYRLVCSIVTMLTELSRLQNIVLQCGYVAFLSKHHKVSTRSAWMKIPTIVPLVTANTARPDLIQSHIKGNNLFPYTQGRTMNQEASRRPLSAEVRFRFQAKTWEFLVDKMVF